VFNFTFAWAVRNDATLHAPGFPIFISATLLFCAFLLALKVGHAPAAVVTAPAE
jgi:hypothetical protein